MKVKSQEKKCKYIGCESGIGADRSGFCRGHQSPSDVIVVISRRDLDDNSDAADAVSQLLQRANCVELFLDTADLSWIRQELSHYQFGCGGDVSINEEHCMTGPLVITL